MTVQTEFSANGIARRIPRRTVLMGLPLMPLAVRALAQQASAEPITVSGLHHFGMRVRDVARSVAFYQGLFGAPVQARRRGTVFLRIGEGPAYFSLTPVQRNEAPHISHIGLAVPDFEASRIQARLYEHGFGRTTMPVVSGQMPPRPLTCSLPAWRRLT